MPKISDYSEPLSRVLSYIQENLDCKLSLESLAQMASFSPFHFHRLFSAYVGEPVTSYIRRLRLEKAAEALCQTEESITSIALSVGYQTVTAFERSFKKYFGVSPTEYLRNLGIRRVRNCL